jgi:FtsP/CotA-like multicopper oxidase with cupredoxin domain
VFEASWRLGGATPAELAAMHLFAENPAIEVVRASTVEAYGVDAAPPPDAIVHFHGEDEVDGPMVRYTVATAALERALA